VADLKKKSAKKGGVRGTSLREQSKGGGEKHVHVKRGISKGQT